MDDTKYMEMALELAQKAQGETSPNPLVGCVIVDAKGNIVGKGYHHKAGEPHAEINALAEAKELAYGSTAYVTLEPCSHFGRTGPCCDALIRAGIKRVVAAAGDPNPQVAGQG
ncbi:MAG: bifunctional diaminohydroxyphosphoribosylaminopyrimidine deaminase/5-amino-6-(5-phosphoribosylamino)uracil reductase RibD, partial [Acidaminococcaceae bacterium]|nr:bifunctional diaminohydroxyphosphoribosylaminopyrimidine deaminase/5-amino-6-(5-phosphoribosylamino)uracil reductase RibD [Acidaminococcaceae bacterium]